MDTFFIKPARHDLIVRDPINLEPLPASGAKKPRSQHWLRRLRDGDVVETKRPKQATQERA